MKRIGAGALSAVLVLVFTTNDCRALTFIVDSVADSGVGSLREKITQANGAAGPDVINFDIPGAGVQTIVLLSSLPTITDTLEIDGYTQSDAAPNTLERNSNAVIRIALAYNGVVSGSNGLSICAPGTVVRGLAIEAFETGIFLGAGADNISCASGSADGTQILGNFVGMDPDGNGSGLSRGIFVNDSSVTIGSGIAGRNAIGDYSIGIFFVGTGVAASVVEGNLIGLRPADGAALGNYYGIMLLDGTALRIGADNAPNRIANGFVGILAYESVVDTTLYANEFGSHTNLAIDLCSKVICPDGATANDADDGDLGANGLQNSPEIFEVKAGVDAFVISGSLDVPTDVTNADYRIAAYWSEACAPAGTGPGEMFLGSGLVNLSGGAEDFDLEVLTALPFGGVVTTTATSESGNTSELSECLIVPTDSVFHDSFE